MKVGKEEIAGLVAAVELWADPAFEKREIAAWEQRTSTFIESMSAVRGLRVYKGVSPPASSGRSDCAAHSSWNHLPGVDSIEVSGRDQPLKIAPILLVEE